jgi:hypothetical protein
MPLHICFDTEPPITTLHGAVKQLVLVCKHVPIQVIFPFITEGAVFKWTIEESLQKQHQKPNCFHDGFFDRVRCTNTLTYRLPKTIHI